MFVHRKLFRIDTPHRSGVLPKVLLFARVGRRRQLLLMNRRDDTKVNTEGYLDGVY